MDSEIKVVLLGDSGVGKTTIVSRYLSGKVPEIQSTTIAAASASKKFTFNNREYNMVIWDTAGQEIYRGLAPLYYRNAEVAIIVFDITKKSTFESVFFWIDELRENVGEKITIIICGNKSDLEEKREVTSKDIDDLINPDNLIYMEVSAITGTGISTIFERGINEVLSTGNSETTTNAIQDLDAQKQEKKGCC